MRVLLTYANQVLSCALGRFPFEILNRPPLNTFLLFGSDQKGPLTALYQWQSQKKKIKKKSFPLLARAGQQLRGGAVKAPLCGRLWNNRDAVRLRPCYRLWCELLCSDRSLLIGAQLGRSSEEGNGGGRETWSREAGRRGWVEGGKGKERIGPLGSCWEPAVDRCKKKR